ncbi:MAG: cytochrome c-type biogenesis protein CcmH [Bauldia sp.]
MRLLRALFAALALSLVFATVGPALAVQPDEVLDDPALEARARSLSAELRCLVCQNQSIDDSASPFAREIRLLLRERLVAGDTDGEVLDFMVARYGEFILLKPAFHAGTALLWLAPPLLLIGGGILAYFTIRRRSARDGAELSADEEKRLAKLIEK